MNIPMTSTTSSLRRALSRRTVLAGAALAATMSMTGIAQAQAQIDQPAPAFSATTADGKTVTLDSYKGKTVVLEWTNHDCPFVKKHYGSGNIPALQKEATAQGVVWLQVISSAPGQQGHVDGATATKLNKDRGAAPTQRHPCQTGSPVFRLRHFQTFCAD